jgi:hypothetical protein
METRTAVLNQTFSSFRMGVSFPAGTLITISKVSQAPNGLRFYQIAETKFWVSDNYIVDLKFNGIPEQRTPLKIFCSQD